MKRDVLAAAPQNTTNSHSETLCISWHKSACLRTPKGLWLAKLLRAFFLYQSILEELRQVMRGWDFSGSS